MNRRIRIVATLAVLVAGGVIEVVAAGAPPAADQADVCASVGRRVRVGGCTDIGGRIANYAPPPAYYAPLPEDYPPPPPPPPPPPAP